MEKVDILTIAAHPDDVELTCAGTLIKMVERGYSVGILDLTQGEMGTRGTPELRAKEAEAARAVIGARFRERLAGAPLSERQRRVVDLLLEGSEARLTTSGYARLAGSSQDTAHRYIQQLIGLGILVQNGGKGRSTSYSLAPELSDL